MRVKPKKSLGQNFLFDKNIQKKILSALELKPDDIVLEIGAGSGEFAELIAERCAKVAAVELDRGLFTALNKRACPSRNIAAINSDILKTDIVKIFGAGEKKIKVFGNIPYYISSPIMEHLFKFKRRISVIFITVQKEFAERVTANPGSKEYGSLSCFARYFSEPKILFEIKRNSFFPSPKVDSAFLRLDIRQEAALPKKREELLFKVIRNAFNQRRKTLRKSLKNIISKVALGAFFARSGLDINIRPEQLSLQDFINLAAEKKS